MGSCTSGNYGRRSFVTFADNLYRVDLLIWRRKGWLRPCISALGMCEIPQPSGRLLTAYSECELKARIGSLRVRFDTLPDLVADLTCTPQRLGGVRWWFVCALCGSNRSKLFFGGSGIWGCRACLQLRYRSQHLRPAARARARCERCYERAGTFHWVTEPRRPRRMHRATFERLIERAKHYRQQWMELGILPIERNAAAFKEKFRRRNARELRGRIPR
jgi:hypothetical protein